MSNNQRWIIADIILIIIFALAINGKSKPVMIEVEKADFEKLIKNNEDLAIIARKYEMVRTNEAKIIGQTNDKIYISIANLLKYEIKVQRSQSTYPVYLNISGGLALSTYIPYVRAPLEVGFRFLPEVAAYMRADALGFITTNFGFEIGLKFVYP